MITRPLARPAVERGRVPRAARQRRGAHL